MLDLSPIIKSLLRNKTGPLLIIVQLALTIAIISNALFFVNERVNQIARPTGIAENEIVKIWMRRNTPDMEFQAIIDRDMDIIRALPGVIAATPITSVPLSGGGSSGGFRRESDPGARSFESAHFPTSSHALATLGLNLIAGRNFREEELSYFSEADAPTASVAIISKALADDMFPDEAALGKTIYMGYFSLTVVGIVERMMGPWPYSDNPLRSVLLPNIKKSDSINYLIRTNEDDRHRIMHTLVEKLRELDDTRLMLDEKTLEQIKRKFYSSDYAMIKILTLVIFMLIFVNVLGILGLTTFWVNQRRKQIGIRRALGATKTAIMRYFLLENVVLVAVASITGGFFAYLASSYTVRAYGLELLPWHYIPLTGGCVLLITLAAASAPIRRAALISPVEAVVSI